MVQTRWEHFPHGADLGVARKVARLVPMICIKG